MMKKNYISALVALFLSVTMSAQIVQVTDINKTGDSGIGSPYFWDGKLYFEADAGDDAADELYVYDGDSAYLLADINQDSLDTTPNGDPKYFTEFNGKLYFSANGGDKIGSDTELYETDGTPEGTKLTFDFNPIPTKAGNPLEFFVFDNKLMMQANDGGTQIWAYDGINDPIKITNKRDGGFFTPYNMMVDGDQVWLKGIDPKYQLWKLTADSIAQLTFNESQNAYTGKGIPYKGGFICNAGMDDKDYELWLSDGTAEGTSLLVDIDTAEASKPEQFTAYNDLVYFVATVGNKTQLWETDATVEGTQLVLAPNDTVDTDITNLIVYNERLFFTLTTQDDVEELWAFDGASASKVATVGDTPGGFIEVDGLLFFIADKKLWYSEGYADVTAMVDSVLDGCAIYEKADDEYAVDGSILYFTADDSLGNDDIYAVDASAIEKEYLPIVLADIKNIHYYKGELFFEAEDQNNNIGDELYKRTAEGEYALVADLNQDPHASNTNSDPKYFIEYKGLLYFNANAGKGTSADPMPYRELHVTDGTTEGTKIAFDLNSAYNKQSNPLELFIFDDKLMMQANEGTSTQIWAYDGTNAPEKMTERRDNGFFTPYNMMVDGDNVWLKGIEPKYQLWKFTTDSIAKLTNNQVKNCYSGKGMPYAGGFIFNGTDDENDTQLWYSDGTAEGTGLLKAIDTVSTKPEQFIEYKGMAYFVVEINEKTQIWKSDATAEGTMVAYDPADTVDVEIENLNTIKGNLVFTANYMDGQALYKVTETGAEMIATVGDSPEDFYTLDELLFFVAGDSLWYTEGTAASTMAVPAEVFEGGVSAEKVDGGEFVANGTVLYFVAEADGSDVIVSIDAADIDRDPAAGIEEVASNGNTASAVSLYPMPSDGVINIASALSFDTYKVFDLSMKEVATSRIENGQINLNLEKGMYILQLENKTTTVAKTVVIK